MTPEAGQQPNQTTRKKEEAKETNKKPGETEAEKKTLWPSNNANITKGTHE